MMRVTVTYLFSLNIKLVNVFQHFNLFIPIENMRIYFLYAHLHYSRLFLKPMSQVQIQFEPVVSIICFLTV